MELLDRAEALKRFWDPSDLKVVELPSRGDSNDQVSCNDEGWSDACETCFKNKWETLLDSYWLFPSFGLYFLNPGNLYTINEPIKSIVYSIKRSSLFY